MKPHVSMFPVGLALSACALAGACTALDPAASVAFEDQAVVQSVNLPGFRANTGDPLDWWVDTGIAVGAGDDVAVTCFGTGRLRPWGGGPQFTCAGDTSQGPWAQSIAPSCRFGSLVGKIGRFGAPFCLDTTASFTAPATGTLHLGFNDGVNFQDNGGSWSIEVEVASSPAVGWTAASHAAGPSWTWNPDPDLQVVLVDDNAAAPWGRGLYVIYDGQVQGSLVTNYPSGNQCSSRYAPLVLVTPRGADPLISGSDDLELAVNGSDENGCGALGYDEATVTVSAQATGGGIDLTTTIDGAVYFAFPSTGTISVQSAGGNDDYAASSLVVNGPTSRVDYDDQAVTRVTSTGSGLGTITLDASPSLPRFHLQGGVICSGGSPPSGFIEGDMDHSCEVSGFGPPQFTLSTHVGP